MAAAVSTSAFSFDRAAVSGSSSLPLPSSKILCKVEHAFNQVIFVSFNDEDGSVFQGALIKGPRLEGPLGVDDFESQLKDDNPRDYVTESFLNNTVDRRHTYFQSSSSSSKNITDVKFRNKANGVRLRARQVLCHHCKNVCNEKGENVQKLSSTMTTRRQTQRRKRSPSLQKRSSGGTKGRLNNNDDELEKIRLARKFSLVPKIKRLEQREIEKFSEIESTQPLIKIKLCPSKQLRDQKDAEEEEENGGRTLRKKRSAVGSMEDLWDETIFEEDSKTNGEETNDNSSSSPPQPPTTPVLKISFGGSERNGKGTVLKIPAKFSEPSSENEENNSERLQRNASAKAAKKALKRARKEAQRLLLASSPYSSACSPVKGVLVSSPHRGINSPVRRSPAYSVLLPPPTGSLMTSSSPGATMIATNPTATTMIIRKPKHHKRKKHKKKKDLELPHFEECRNDYTIGCQTVDSCLMENDHGTQMCVGDIIWGKHEPNPWWPGKVSDIYLKPDECGDIHPLVKISWYKVDTTSLLTCAQIKPFREFFRDCFNSSHGVKKYEEAVRQATNDSAVTSHCPSPSPIPNSFASPSNSPRPVDCQS